MDSSSLSTNSPLILLRANEVADRLDISRSQAYQLMRQGEIPTIRFGNSVRVRECDLEEYVMRHWSGWNS